MNSTKLGIVALAVVLAGCGSDDEGSREKTSESSSDPSCERFTGLIDPSALIDDFEDGDSQLAELGGRRSQWWISVDETANGSVTPPPGAVTPQRILGGRCGSSFGLRFSGQGYSDWGAVMSVSMRYEDGKGEVPLDLSAYRGVRFWARAGELNTASVRVGFHDVTAHPNGGVCDEDSMEIGVQCWDSFGTDIRPLDTEWREYAIYFDRLSQRDFGVKAPALATSQIYVLEFSAPQDSIFDFWVDDIWLLE